MNIIKLNRHIPLVVLIVCTTLALLFTVGMNINYDKTNAASRQNIIALQDINVNKISTIPPRLIKQEDYPFNVSELNNYGFSEVFLLRHSDLRHNMVNYCSNHTALTQTALVNCNTVAKVDNSWYLISYFSSQIIKNAFSSVSSFAITFIVILFILAIVVNLSYLTRSFLRLLNPFIRVSKKCEYSKALALGTMSSAAASNPKKI
jgi:hypothetical protein